MMLPVTKLAFASSSAQVAAQELFKSHTEIERKQRTEHIVWARFLLCHGSISYAIVGVCVVTVSQGELPPGYSLLTLNTHKTWFVLVNHSSLFAYIMSFCWKMQQQLLSVCV